MIFSDIEDTTFVALYTVIKDVLMGDYIYKNIYTKIPLLIDARNEEEAREKAKEHCNRKMILEEIREINVRDRDKILNFYRLEV